VSPEAFSDPAGPVLVVDFGAQYAQLIARRVREAHVYSEIVPHTITAEEIRRRKPAGVIFSGGPKSVHVEGAPVIDETVYDLGVPIFGICYGAQLIAQQLPGGTVANTGVGEYGRTDLDVVADGVVFGGGQPKHQQVWMSHFDSIATAPEGFTVTATTTQVPVAAMEDVDRRIHAVHTTLVHQCDKYTPTVLRLPPRLTSLGTNAAHEQQTTRHNRLVAYDTRVTACIPQTSHKI
jgi:GMP synthase (glutamine-hydrolysing)